MGAHRGARGCARRRCRRARNATSCATSCALVKGVLYWRLDAAFKARGYGRSSARCATWIWRCEELQSRWIRVRAGARHGADQHRRVRRAHRRAGGAHQGACATRLAQAPSSSRASICADRGRSRAARSRSSGSRPTRCRRASRWPTSTTALRTQAASGHGARRARRPRRRAPRRRQPPPPPAARTRRRSDAALPSAAAGCALRGAAGRGAGAWRRRRRRRSGARPSAI